MWLPIYFWGLRLIVLACPVLHTYTHCEKRHASKEFCVIQCESLVSQRHTKAKRMKIPMNRCRNDMMSCVNTSHVKCHCHKNGIAACIPKTQTARGRHHQTFFYFCDPFYFTTFLSFPSFAAFSVDNHQIIIIATTIFQRFCKRK